MSVTIYVVYRILPRKKNYIIYGFTTKKKYLDYFMCDRETKDYVIRKHKIPKSEYRKIKEDYGKKYKIGIEEILDKNDTVIKICSNEFEIKLIEDICYSSMYEAMYDHSNIPYSIFKNDIVEALDYILYTQSYIEVYGTEEEIECAEEMASYGCSYLCNYDVTLTPCEVDVYIDILISGPLWVRYRL